MNEPVLQLKHIRTAVQGDEGPVTLVDDVSFDVFPGEMFGVVGESGVGKTTLALSVLGLMGPLARVRGEVWHRGRELLSEPDRVWRSLLGQEIAFIPSSGKAALNPVFTVGRQLTDVVRAHRDVSPDEAHEAGVGMLARVGMSDPKRRMRSYPHELSGGMAQRAAIAMALVNHPQVVIADEPTGGLDVTIQAQILDLMAELNATLGHSTILISRDLGIIANYCARVGVMFRGRLVELGPLTQVYAQTGHPYSEALLDAFSLQREKVLHSKQAASVALVEPPPHGCPYEPRCPYSTERCIEEDPGANVVGSDHWARCHYAGRFSVVSSDR